MQNHSVFGFLRALLGMDPRCYLLGSGFQTPNFKIGPDTKILIQI